MRDQLREWHVASIVSVRASDSLTNGTVIGAIAVGTAGLFAGAAAAVAAGGVFSDDYNWCAYLGGGVGAIGGAFLGRTIDAHIHGRVLFWRPVANLTVEPLLPSAVAYGRSGIRVALRF